MSTDTFIHSLVEMSRAYEELPQVKAELASRIAQLDAALNSVADREQSIISLKAEIDALHAKNRELEVQRDDAELRFLELDDKANKVHRLLADAEASLRSAATSLEVAKPEPEAVSVQPDPTVQDPVATTQSETVGSTIVQQQDAPTPEQAPQQAQPSPMPPSAPITSYPSEGQSVPNPTEGPMASYSSEAPVASSAGPSAEGVSVSPDPTVPTALPSQSMASSTVATAASPSPEPAVGYHNEPSPRYSVDWYHWSAKMDAIFGAGFWPQRPAPIF